MYQEDALRILNRRGCEQNENVSETEHLGIVTANLVVGDHLIDEARRMNDHDTVTSGVGEKQIASVRRDCA